MGRLVAAHAARGIVTRRNVDQLDQIEVLADSYQDMPIAPNDLALDAEGGVYFTDFAFPPMPGEDAVFYINAAGDLQKVGAGPVTSNGIGWSPDGETLYVASSVGNSIFAYNVNDDHTLSNERLFAGVPGSADGMTVDRFGNVFSSDVGWPMGPPAEIFGLPDSIVRVWNPAGEEILTFKPPQGVINLAFGAPDDTLYITGWNSLHRVAIEYVPEPSSVALLGVGTLVLLGWRKRQRLHF